MADQAQHQGDRWTVLRQGGGPPPGYEWTVEVMERAYAEAKDFLSDAQYEHLADQFREMAARSEPTRCETVDLRPIEEFYELRDKGGPLGAINVRIFFCIDRVARSIIVLGAINKKNDGPTQAHTKFLMRNRMRSCIKTAG